MTVKICLMCKEGEGLKQVNTKGWSIKSSDLSSMSLSPKDNGFWETGDWVVDCGNLKDFLGKNLVLTQSRDTPAYIGGTIKGFRVVGKRVVFEFQEDPSLRGFKGHIGSWQSSNPVFYL